MHQTYICAYCVPTVIASIYTCIYYIYESIYQARYFDAVAKGYEEKKNI